MVDRVPSSDPTQCALSSPLVVPKKMRVATSTIAPHLLSLVDQTNVLGEDDQDTLLHPWYKDPTTLNLGARDSA